MGLLLLQSPLTASLAPEWAWLRAWLVLVALPSSPHPVPGFHEASRPVATGVPELPLPFLPVASLHTWHSVWALLWP